MRVAATEVARMPGWAVGPCVYHGDDAQWHITAVVTVVAAGRF
jgi:hypothetical protein